MIITNPETHQTEELRDSLQFNDDVTDAVRLSGLTDFKDMKKYWSWYARQYSRLHVRKSKFDGNINEGANLKKMIKYLEGKIGQNTPTTTIAKNIDSLHTQGFLSNAEYREFFWVLCDVEARPDAAGIQVMDYSTANIVNHRWPIVQILDEAEGQRLVATFIDKPWKHATRATNQVLWEMLAHKIHMLAEKETGLIIRAFHLRKRSSSGVSPFEVCLSDGTFPISEPQSMLPVAKEFGGRGKR